MTKRQASGVPYKRVNLDMPAYIKQRLKEKADAKGVSLARYIVAIIRSKPEPDEMYLR